MVFSNFEKLKQKSTSKNILKDSKDNIIGIIDENNNLLMINPNYKLQVSKTIQSNDNELIIVNKHNYGIKISDSIKFITPDGEKNISENHVHDYKTLNNIPNIVDYTDEKSRNACHNKIDSINSQKLNGYVVDNDKMIWDGKLIKSELNKKSNLNHVHDIKEIKNLPVSITQEKVNILISNLQKELKNYVYSYFKENIKEKLKQYSLNDHTHKEFNIDIFTKDEILELLNQFSKSDHTHSFPVYTDKDTIKVIKGQRLINTDQLNIKLKNYSNIIHKHSENEIQDLDKYSKNEIKDLLSDYSKLNHKHDKYATKNELYTDKDVKNVIDTYKDFFIHKLNLDEILKNYSKTDHIHEQNIDHIFDHLKTKIKTYLDGNINSINSQKLQGKDSSEFADVKHSHNFTDLNNRNHVHTEKEIRDLDKYKKSEVDKLLSNKANDKHKHHISDIVKFPKLYSDSDTNSYIQNNIIDDTKTSNNKVFSSEKVEVLLNNRARVEHSHKLQDVQEIKGYIERTVDMAVRVHVKNHKHSMFDITDKPTFYSDSQAKKAIGGQVNDNGYTTHDLWTADKIQKELAYLKKLIDSK